MSKKILVVDDDSEVRATLETLLQGEGYRVVTAANGLEALRRASAEAPDLILLDVVMPRMSGLEVLQELRSREQFATTLVVVLSASAELPDMEQGWRKGCDLYLTKPFAPAELLSFLETILAD